MADRIKRPNGNKGIRPSGFMTGWLRNTRETLPASYRTVAGYVAKRKKEIFGQRPGYLPLDTFRGKHRRILAMLNTMKTDALQRQYLNLSFPYSNKGYFQVSKEENQECLFEGLIAIFEHIGGVPRKSGFDNTKTIVTKVLKEGERTLTTILSDSARHYRF